MEQVLAEDAVLQRADQQPSDAGLSLHRPSRSRQASPQPITLSGGLTTSVSEGTGKRGDKGSSERGNK